MVSAPPVTGSSEGNPDQARGLLPRNMKGILKLRMTFLPGTRGPRQTLSGTIYPINLRCLVTSIAERRYAE